MTSWHLWTQSAEQWNNQLSELDGSTPFQVWSWGEVKKAQGWGMLRLFCQNSSGKILTLVQVQFKKIGPLAALCWVPGGAAGYLSVLDSSFVFAVKKNMGVQFIYIRMNALRSDEDRKSLPQIWGAPIVKMGTGQSMLAQLKLQSDPGGLDLYSSNWRHNVKRGLKKDLVISQGPVSFEELLAIYREMEDYKEIAQQYSETELRLILEKMNSDLSVVTVRGSEGKLLSFRACVIIGAKAWDFLAVSSIHGRSVYSSYLGLHSLFGQVREKNVFHYDLMGIDKENNPGVYNFKKGTGAEEISYLGNIETANFPGVRWCSNMLIQWKLGRRV